MTKALSKISFLLKGIWIFTGFILLIGPESYSQNQKVADSLEKVYLENNYENENELNLLKLIIHNQNDPDVKLHYSIELIEKATKLDSVDKLLSGLLEKGNAYLRKGDLTNSLLSYFDFAQIASDIESKSDLGKVYMSIANIYSVMENHENSILYYQDALDILRKENDTLGTATTLENLGFEYLSVAKPDSALIFLNESGQLFKALDYRLGIAYNLGNKGLAYAQLGNSTKAENSIDKALEITNELGDHFASCDFLIQIASIYVQREDYQKAENFAFRSLDLAQQYGLKNQISQANLKLSEINELSGNSLESLQYFKNHIAYRDSVHNLESVQQIANMRTNFEVSQKQLEVDLLNQQKTNQKILIFSLLAILVMIGLYYRTITKAKRRSDDLLLNILPSGTAEELKENGKVKAKKFESITVMFTDFQAFTKYSQKLSPEVLVESVDYYFSKFDEIIDKYGLEKIKTIGDAYMCAGGLPFETKDHPIKIIKAAFEISKFIQESENSNLGELAHFNIRIGINTGPVVAGVVGSKKFAYDIWGDTVNVASRMESNSEPSRINISENTYQLVKDHFDCEYRGEIDVKNKGMMKMYFVTNEKIKKDLLSQSIETQKVLY